jgi:hypothetical protein
MKKDNELDLMDFNNLLVGCSTILSDVDLRKQVLRIIFKKCKKSKMSIK